MNYFKNNLLINLANNYFLIILYKNGKKTYEIRRQYVSH